MVANVITIVTALSLSSISTRLRVGQRGAYFLISHALGLAAGGAVGLPLFHAQAVSVAFYIVGFTESRTFIFPPLPDLLISGSILACIFIIT